MARIHGINSKYARKRDPLFDILFKVGKSMISSYKRESNRRQREIEKNEAAYIRSLYQRDRERIRQMKQHELATHRAEREREKAEREREREAKLQSKLLAEKWNECDISNIEVSNYLWTNIHILINDIVTIEDVNDTIAQCNFEQQNHVPDGLFRKKYPSDKEAVQKAQEEGNKRYDIDQAQKEYDVAEKDYKSIVFEEVEPTREIVSEELANEAIERIDAFFPWTRSKLRKAYIAENIDLRYKELHDLWQSKKNKIESIKETLYMKVEEKKKLLAEMLQSKNDYIDKRSKELYQQEVDYWETEREDFFNILRQNLQEVISGDRDYVITAISSLFPNDEIPLNFFVDFVYVEEKGKVMVDLDLPEIEDIPNKKIVLTPTGKKSIRLKGQTELNLDYANCIFGLAMYISHLIFNVSIKIQEIEICGFTQRKESNSAVAIDQYIFVVSFTRDLFSRVPFNTLSAIQIMDFFQHHYIMSKSYFLKPINLGTAFDMMNTFIPVDYNTFIISHASANDDILESQRQKIINLRDNSDYLISSIDNPVELFEKAYLFVKYLYKYINILSLDTSIKYHANNLSNVNVRFINGEYTGDGNTATYRGKLFFLTVIDMFRSLQMMHINTHSLSPSTYPLALFIIKIYAQKEIQYSMLNRYESFYHTFISMIETIEKEIPKPNHVYLLGDILLDYDIKTTWYDHFLKLMKQHLNIVKCSVRNSLFKMIYVDNFDKYHMSIDKRNIYYNLSYDEDMKKDIEILQLDPLFHKAAELVVATGIASISMIQRKLEIGYNRANNIMEQLEMHGVVGPYDGNRNREVLLRDEIEIQSIIEKLKE